jgi:predicted house-cleaning noncanonical NTP pyrophosphatase (MazG superfamily)
MAKLVRDKIPDIIRKEGRRAMTHIASDVEFRVALRQKLQEEVDEFLDSDNP